MRYTLPRELGVIIALSLILLGVSFWQHDFLTQANLHLLMRQWAQPALVASGMTLVITTGGIDLSVGSVLGLSAMMMGVVSLHTNGNIPLSCLAALATGLACGLVNGLLIGYGKLPPILVTLASFAAARAGATLLYHGSSISSLPGALNDTVERVLVAGFPMLFWVGLLALIIASILLRHTTFGRSILAIGGSRVTSSLSGVSISFVETLVYTLSGLCAGGAAIINVALKATATPDAGQYLELRVITAVVLGGTAISGGKATLFGTGLGVLTMLILLSGARLAGQEDRTAWFLVGIALLIAVEAQRALQKRENVDVAPAQ